MKRKYLFLALATLLAAGGLWLGRTAWRTHEFNKSSTGVAPTSSTRVDFKAPNGGLTPGQTNDPPPRLAPPDPTRRFKDFTPEQRVEFARKGHGPGG